MWWIKIGKTGRETLFFGGECAIFGGEKGENDGKSSG
jgi:hypothetical protein